MMFRVMNIQLGLAVLFAVASSGDLVAQAMEDTLTGKEETKFGFDTFNIEMELEGFPLLNSSSSDVFLWRNLTSEHVLAYWKDRDYKDFDVTRVHTNFVTQIRLNSDKNASLRTEIVYDQRINFTQDGPDGPLLNSNGTYRYSSDLFLRPFESDAQRYVDELQKAFDIENPVVWGGISVIPTPAPAPYEKDNGLSAGAAAGIAFGVVVACGIALFLVLAYYRTRVSRERGTRQESARDKPTAEAPTTVDTSAHHHAPSDEEEAVYSVTQASTFDSHDDDHGHNADFYFE